MKVDYSNLVKELKSIGISISNYSSDSFTNLSIKEYNDLNVLLLNIMDVFHGETWTDISLWYIREISIDEYRIDNSEELK